MLELLISTRKGLFQVSSSDRETWVLGEPQFLGQIVHHAVLDPRDGRTMLAAVRTGHLGPTLFRSGDCGATWSETARPPAFRKARGGETPRSVQHTFWITPGHVSEPGVWWAGTSPQALWVSEDAGLNWSGVAGFNDHADYAARTEDPQGGTPDGPVLHSILVDPRDADHMYLGLSGGGVYESLDHGANWSPMNDGMATAEADPDAPEGEVQPTSIQWQPWGPSHDPHCVQIHPLFPDRLYQQNHCGIYRLDRPETRWQRIGRNMPADVGDIGFVMGVHPRDKETCWVFPMDGTDVWPRTSPGGRPAVFVTRDGGERWIRQDAGLPERGWLTVKRQGLALDSETPVGVYFGTTSGGVWASADEGARWQQIAAHLPEIYSVEACYPQR